MPEITSCPDCSKKLRVPDDLLGKKVRCPGCGVMFTASVAGADPDRDEEEPPRRAPSRSREDDDRDDDRRPRREAVSDRRDAPRSRGRDDDYDDRRPRRRDDEDDDDRPRRRGRDEDFYEDDYGGGGRSERQGWKGVRTGLGLVVISGWLLVTIYGLGVLGGGVALMIGISSASSFAGGGQGPPPALGAMAVLGCMFLVFFVLGGFAEMILRVTGIGICMQVPSRRGPARGLCIGAFICAILAVFIAIGSAVLGGFSGPGRPGGGPPMAAFVGAGNVIGLLGNVVGFAGWVMWMFCVRSICQEVRAKELAGRVLVIFLTMLGYGFLAVLILVGIAFGVGFGMATAGNQQNAFAALGGGMIALFVIGGLLFLGWVAIYVWYVMTLGQVKLAVEKHISRT